MCFLESHVNNSIGSIVYLLLEINTIAYKKIQHIKFKKNKKKSVFFYNILNSKKIEVFLLTPLKYNNQPDEKTHQPHMVSY